MVLKILNERRDGEEFKLDIVFLHGLKGDLEKTWTHQETKAHWPRDWLPTDVPGARVMTFGYNADAAFGNSTADILDHAKDLLSSLIDQREEAEETERPLIFIGHSLGGIVIKQALVYAMIDKRYNMIRESTLGIVFFGTPHRGSDFATYGETLASVVRMVTLKPSSQLLKALRSNSDDLYKLSTYFQSELQRLQIVSFYERQPMAGSSLIVNEHSTLLLVPNEESLPVDADHSMICKFKQREDSTYEKCYKRIKRIAKECNRGRAIATTPVPGNVHWYMSRGVNPLFVGQEDIIEKLETALLSGSVPQQKRFVISGMGGAGKSEVCLKFAAVHRKRYWAVLWVDCGEAGTAERSFITFAERCDYHAQDFDGAKTWLANLKKSWLLIIDNADDTSFDYDKYFPPCDSGSIILTTRNPECSIHQTVGHTRLEGLDLGNAWKLLLKAAQIEESTWPEHQHAAEEVVNLLGAHPLALIQAGTVIKKRFCTLNDYPNHFKERRRWLLQSHTVQGKSRYKDVYATFEISANILENSSAQEAVDALQLLRILAFMHFDGVSYTVFEKAFTGMERTRMYSEKDIEDNLNLLSGWHISQLPDFVSRATSIGEVKVLLNQACDLLASSSLITIVQVAANVSISMHPLVHAWAKDRLTQSQADWWKAWSAAGSVLAISIDIEVRDPSFHYKLLPHAQAFIGSDSKLPLHPDTIVEFSRTFRRLSWFLMYYRFHPATIRVCREMLDRISVELQLTPSQICSIRISIAQCSTALQEYERTITVLEDLIEIHMTTLDTIHPNRLVSQHELAQAYMEAGQYQKALELLKEVVDIRMTILDPAHPDRLSSQHGLARAYMETGQYQKALELLKEVVDIRMTILDPAHPNRLSSQHGLARAYMETGQYQKALELLKEIVDIRMTILDPAHPNRLSSQYGLARAYMETGQYQKALELLKEIVDIQMTILDPAHPDRLSSQHELARAYMETGQYQKALELLKEIVDIQMKILDPAHPDHLSSQHELARAYMETGRHQKALELLKEIIDIRMKILDPVHPYHFSSQHELARAYMETGQYQKALELLKEIVDIRMKILDPAHPDRLSSQHELARVYMETGRYQKAFELLKEVVDIRMTILDPDRLSSQHGLARAYMETGQYPQALQSAEEVAKIEAEFEHVSDRDVTIDLIKKAMDRENNNRAEILDVTESPVVDGEKAESPGNTLALRRREDNGVRDDGADSGREHSKSIRASIRRVFKRS